MALCPVRCFCGAELQSKYTVYCEKLRLGLSVKEALDTCGIAQGSPFAPDDPNDPDYYVSPPSLCCRALMMCNSDLSTVHNVYQQIVRWAEADTTTIQPNQHIQQQHIQQQPSTSSLSPSTHPTNANVGQKTNTQHQQRKVTFATQ
jgi:DNA-directed RNA polymerase subunit N (RpoN/RPB10)